MNDRVDADQLADARTHDIREGVDRDFRVIVERFLTNERADAIAAELDPSIQQTAPVGDDIAGHRTTRAGGLAP